MTATKTSPPLAALLAAEPASIEAAPATTQASEPHTFDAGFAQTARVSAEVEADMPLPSTAGMTNDEMRQVLREHRAAITDEVIPRMRLDDEASPVLDALPAEDQAAIREIVRSGATEAEQLAAVQEILDRHVATMTAPADLTKEEALDDERNAALKASLEKTLADTAKAFDAFDGNAMAMEDELRRQARCAETREEQIARDAAINAKYAAAIAAPATLTKEEAIAAATADCDAALEASRDEALQAIGAAYDAFQALPVEEADFSVVEARCAEIAAEQEARDEATMARHRAALDGIFRPIYETIDVELDGVFGTADPLVPLPAGYDLRETEETFLVVLNLAGADNRAPFHPRIKGNALAAEQTTIGEALTYCFKDAEGMNYRFLAPAGAAIADTLDVYAVSKDLLGYYLEEISSYDGIAFLEEFGTLVASFEEMEVTIPWGDGFDAFARAYYDAKDDEERRKLLLQRLRGEETPEFDAEADSADEFLNGGSRTITVEEVNRPLAWDEPRLIQAEVFSFDAEYQFMSHPADPLNATLTKILEQWSVMEDLLGEARPGSCTFKFGGAEIWVEFRGSDVDIRSDLQIDLDAFTRDREALMRVPASFESRSSEDTAIVIFDNNDYAEWDILGGDVRINLEMHESDVLAEQSNDDWVAEIVLRPDWWAALYVAWGLPREYVEEYEHLAKIDRDVSRDFVRAHGSLIGGYEPARKFITGLSFQDREAFHAEWSTLDVMKRRARCVDELLALRRFWDDVAKDRAAAHAA